MVKLAPPSVKRIHGPYDRDGIWELHWIQYLDDGTEKQFAFADRDYPTVKAKKQELQAHLVLKRKPRKKNVSKNTKDIPEQTAFTLPPFDGSSSWYKSAIAKIMEAISFAINAGDMRQLDMLKKASSAVSEQMNAYKNYAAHAQTEDELRELVKYVESVQRGRPIIAPKTNDGSSAPLSNPARTLKKVTKSSEEIPKSCGPIPAN